MKNVLIYGASGLIGSALIARLLKSGESKIYAVTKTGLRDYLKLELGNLESKIQQGVSLLDFSVDIKFDYIYHLGYSSQPSIFSKNLAENYERNLIIIPELLNRLKTTGRIIYASSSEIYNGCQSFPCDESHVGSLGNVDRVDYMVSKIASEKYLSSLAEKGLAALILRISLVYGPRVAFDDSRVMYKFIRDGMSGGIEVAGDPNAKRSYLFVDDLLDALLKLDSVSATGIYNVAGSEEVSIAKLASLIGKIMNVHVRFHQKPIPLGAPKFVRIDTSLLRESIGEFEKTELSIGLERTIKWFENTYSPSSY